MIQKRNNKDGSNLSNIEICLPSENYTTIPRYKNIDENSLTEEEIENIYKDIKNCVGENGYGFHHYMSGTTYEEYLLSDCGKNYIKDNSIS
jgi:hypothetical protein